MLFIYFFIFILAEFDAFPATFNRNIVHLTDICDYGLFHKTPLSTKLVGFSSCRFNELTEDIKKLLAKCKLGTIDIQIKHVSDSNENDHQFVRLVGNMNLFQDLAPRKLMTLVVKSEAPSNLVIYSFHVL